MAECHWNKLQKRLKNIIDPKLNIKFNNSPVRKKTSWSEITIRFFQVILDDEIIWKFPKDTNQQKDMYFCIGQYKISKYEYGKIEFPIMSIINYLDLPKDKLLDYQDKAGLSDVLKSCDKRIGYNRLKTLQLSQAGQKIFNKRFEHMQAIQNINWEKNNATNNY